MPIRILLIDKDEMTAAVKALELAGYDVIKAVNAVRGLKKLREVRPDLVILGNPLPQSPGEELVWRIRQASYLPIVVIGNKEKETESLEQGADAYVPKPPNMSELVARVRALLRRKIKQE